MQEQFNQPAQLNTKPKLIPTWLGILIIVLVAVLLFGGVFGLQYYLNQNNTDFQNENNQNTETAGWQTYTNTEYGFEVSFPQRWSDYRVEKSENTVIFKLESSLDNDYHRVFSIGTCPKEDFQKGEFYEVKTGCGGNYISEKDGMIFNYSLGHDDEGYVGFPEVEPSKIYQGPYYDVQNKIIPTFKFIN